jgi:hypothetical protein
MLGISNTLKAVSTRESQYHSQLKQLCSVLNWKTVNDDHTVATIYRMHIECICPFVTLDADKSKRVTFRRSARLVEQMLTTREPLQSTAPPCEACQTARKHVNDPLLLKIKPLRFSLKTEAS